MTGAAVVARARALVGVPFRAQGRDPQVGLDCVGLAAAAVGARGVPDDYRLRSGGAVRLAAGLRAAGLTAVAVPIAGDVLVLCAGPGQLHLAVWTGAGTIEADARARRVVERPGAPAWPVLGSWRAREEA